MIDNFERISEYLSFDSSDDYYFLQILIRAKEDKTLGSNNLLIKTYAVKSIESLRKYEQEIKTICTNFKARAYIHLTKRSFRKVALIMMKELCDRISNDQCPEIAKAFNSASGTYNDAKAKTWIVDIDTKNMRLVNDVLRHIEKNCDPIGGKFITMVETPNGCHIITTPFNTEQLKRAYPDIDVHKNNPTILFVP
jgi:pimeloyl-CoA synthetase